MERTLIKVGPGGEVTLPATISHAMGFPAGAEVEVFADGRSVTFAAKPEKTDPAEFDRLLSQLQSLYKGQPSLEDELLQCRREDEEHSREKYGW